MSPLPFSVKLYAAFLISELMCRRATLRTGPNTSLTEGMVSMQNTHHMSAAVLRGSQLITSGAARKRERRRGGRHKGINSHDRRDL